LRLSLQNGREQLSSGPYKVLLPLPASWTGLESVGKFLQISGDFRSVGNVERGKKVPEAFTTDTLFSTFWLRFIALESLFLSSAGSALTSTESSSRCFWLCCAIVEYCTKE
jgi:hypothetical protein